mmetsp:Transcript_17044/g.42700  ORF Transcript_17044/g.42700 Transcript_17044/m.42700 type:complete len:112 (+) Transcript_17044:1048-1383(+)
MRPAVVDPLACAVSSQARMCVSAGPTGEPPGGRMAGSSKEVASQASHSKSTAGAAATSSPQAPPIAVHVCARHPLSLTEHTRTPPPPPQPRAPKAGTRPGMLPASTCQPAS